MISKSLVTVEQIITHCGYGKTLLACSKAEEMLTHFLDKGIDARCLGDNLNENWENNEIEIVRRLDNWAFEEIKLLVDRVDTIFLDIKWVDFDEANQINLVRKLYEASKRFVCIQLHQDEGSIIDTRSRIEEIFLKEGFRKHFKSVSIENYTSIDFPQPYSLLFYEKVSPSGRAFCPLSSLYEYRSTTFDSNEKLDATFRERDIHMDMLRESGHRSDSHIVRYSLAANYVKPQDTVLDASCGLGYGTHIIYENSKSKNIVGVDCSNFAIDYARANYSVENEGIQFLTQNLKDSLPFERNEFDVIVSFETLEHLKEPDLFLNEALRILKPGGRFVVSVPNMWIDETGKDPWIFHEQEFNLNKFLNTVEAYFRLDSVFRQSAGGDHNRFGKDRKLEYVEPTNFHEQSDAEWWIGIFYKDPLGNESVPYREVAITENRISEKHAEGVSTGYCNPWLLHTLVHIGYRVSSSSALADLFERTLEEYDIVSNDYGCALCVKAYQILSNSKTSASAINECLNEIEVYLNKTDGASKFLRWRISLSYIAAKLNLRIRKFSEAKKWFCTCTTIDPLEVVPHIGTKTTDAAFQLGNLQYVSGGIDEAKDSWKFGLETVRRIIQSDWIKIILDENCPNDFGNGDGLREIALIVDNGIKCANGLRMLACQQQGRVFSEVKIYDSFGSLELERGRLLESLGEETRIKHEMISWANEESGLARRAKKLLSDSERQRDNAFTAQKELERLVSELRDAVSEESAEKDRIRAWAEEEHANVRKLRSLLNDAEKQRDDAYSTQEELERSVSELRDAVSEESAEKDRLRAWAKEEHANALKLKSLLSDAEKQRDDAYSAQEELERLVSALRSAVDEESAEKDSARAWAEEERRCAGEISRQLSITEQKCNDAQRQIIEFQASLLKMLEEKSELNEQLEKSRYDCNRLNQIRGDLELEVKVKKEEISDLRCNNSDLSNQLLKYRSNFLIKILTFMRIIKR